MSKKIKTNLKTYTYKGKVLYARDGIMELPDDAVIPKGLGIEVLEDNPDQETVKAELVEKAVSLGIGNKSTLARWGVEKLQEEISKAEAGEDSEDQE